MPCHLSCKERPASPGSSRVKDMKQYMLAVLYNAPTTISSYYQNWVQHDMANGLIYWQRTSVRAF